MTKINYLEDFIKSLGIITGIPIDKIEEYSKINDPLNILERPYILQPDKEQLNKLQLLKEFVNQYNLVKDFGKDEKIKFNSLDIASKFFQNMIGSRKDKEIFIVAFLDTKLQLIESKIVSEGTLNSALVSPKEILKAALASECSAIIMSHNHPSGDPTPSQKDIDLTQKIFNIFNPLQIRVLDHIVVGDYPYSLLENGFMPTSVNDIANYDDIIFNEPIRHYETEEDIFEEDELEL